MNALSALAPGSLPPPATAERLLLDTARRLLRQPEGWRVLVLRLSRVARVQPHHRRVALALVRDAAQRLGGQVFTLRNADLVLLCQDPPASARPGADPHTLPATLARLLAAVAPETDELILTWQMDAAPDRLVQFATARLADTVALPRESAETVPQAGDIDTLAGLAGAPGVLDLLHRQTAILLDAPRPRHEDAPGGRALRPLFTELGFSMAALEARGGQTGIGADPWLLRHLATRLDAPLLSLAAGALGGGGPLDALGARAGRPRLHLNLTLPGVLGDAFGRLASAAREGGAGLGVEIACSEAVADPSAFLQARERLGGLGAALVLDGVSHLALLLAQPWMLGGTLLKLDWSAHLPALPAGDHAELTAAIGRIGAHRVVLHRADGEAALRWGLAHGIRRFQGRHADAMLGAARVLACPAAAACTLHQCIERAAAVSPGGRAGCGCRTLLDAAAP